MFYGSEVKTMMPKLHSDNFKGIDLIRPMVFVKEEDIIKAAKAAEIYDLIESLPQGFDTILSERGAGISEGQIQRISIARALLTDAPILLLGFLLISVLLGFLNTILSLVMVIVSPIFGILYTFFFSNIFGKQISKAIFSAALITALLFVLEFFGYGVICISAAALISYLPLLIALLALWYLIGHLL